jgi:hypothetical protein
MTLAKFGIFIAIAFIFAIMAQSAAFARGPGGMGGGPHGFVGGNPPGFSKGMKTGWNGASVPPGWSKGKKKGWRGASVPPGLYRR